MTETRRDTTRGLRPGIVLVLVALVAALAAASLATPAAAATPCWKQVLNDWFVDGRIDHTYPIHCYTQAQKHVNEDAKQYSTVQQDIQRALLSAVREKKAAKQAQQQQTTTSQSHTDTSATVTASSGGGSSGGSGGSGGSGSPAGPTPTPTHNGPAGTHKGPLTRAIDWLGPSNAETIPTPLLVLAGVAILLLLAAAASWFARRMQSRRLRPAPAPETRRSDQR
jgi:cobalamin biosynthesis Mg chelatase CobN